MTLKELRSELIKSNIEFKHSDTKKDLESLYDEYIGQYKDLGEDSEITVKFNLTVKYGIKDEKSITYRAEEDGKPVHYKIKRDLALYFIKRKFASKVDDIKVI